jgi:hypothetical protein
VVLASAPIAKREVLSLEDEPIRQHLGQSSMIENQWLLKTSIRSSPISAESSRLKAQPFFKK